MKQTKLLLILFCFFNSVTYYSQVLQNGNRMGRGIGNGQNTNNTGNNSTTNVKVNGKTKYTDYKIFTHNRDTSFVDTTLSLEKEYKFNYLRRDNFELLQFHNQGQTYNNLGYTFNLKRFPDIGFSAKQFPYLDIEDIKYYEVPTPTSEITYKTGLQQGQFVDAIFSWNFNRRLNVSLSYKGLRSLGAYRRSLVSNGNFRTSFHYRTKENQYQIRGHATSQDFFHQESGGLTPNALQSFIEEDPNFDQRSRLDVNLIDAENQFDSNRFYIEQAFTVISKRNRLRKEAEERQKDSIAIKELNKIQDSIASKTQLNDKDSLALSTLNKDLDTISKNTDVLTKPLKKGLESFAESVNSITDKQLIKKDSLETTNAFVKSDSISTTNSSQNLAAGNIKIGHVFILENKSYEFIQPTDEISIFGNVSPITDQNNIARSSLLDNEVNLEFNSKYILGQLKARVNLTSMSYGYDTIFNGTASVSNIELSDNVVSLGASWNARIKNFNLTADAQVTPGSGILSGNHFIGEASYVKDSVFAIKGSLLLNSRSPNFNTLLHQSKYDDYNWENSYSNVNTRDLGFDFQSKWINASANYTNIDNFTYFDENNLPQQFDEQVNYLKVKVNKEIKYWKIGLDNTVMYQNVTDGSSVFRVPEIVTRNTLYYEDDWFKGKPMRVNIGVTFRYFTSYFANAYNPILAEFTLQNEEEIGFPTFDVFFNARVRRTRLFLKVDNVSSLFSEKNYFSAPNYPFRDFTVRFGLVWNWFI